MEEDVLRQKEVVSVTFDTTSFLFRFISGSQQHHQIQNYTILEQLFRKKIRVS